MKELTITVSEAGTAAARTFAYEISSLGKVLAERTLTPIQSQQVMEIASQYFSLLRGTGLTESKSYLAILRKSLSHIFLEAGAQEWRDEILPGAKLVVSSSIPEVLELPWELLSLARNEEQRCDILVVRRPGGDEVSAHLPEISAGPLRLLFMAANSQGYEEEERRILQMGEGLNMEIAVSESGRPEDLRAHAEQFWPHLIHLSVQAKASGGKAAISFAGSQNRAVDMEAEGLADLLSSKGLWGIVISGRAGDEPSARHLFCQSLSCKISLALALDGPSGSLLPLYRALAAGKALEEALMSIRREAACSSDGSVFVPSPALYKVHSGDIGPMIDTNLKPAPSDFRHCLDLESLPGLAEGGTECFVGRRRETERLHSALRDGSVQTLVITGPDGSGKSALAVRLSRLMAQAGYSILPIYSSPYNSMTCTRLIEAVADHLSRKGLEEEARRLKEAGQTPERLEVIMEILKSHRMLMLWDGLDLDEQSDRIKDPELSRLYLKMIRGMTAGRAIITASALPADALTLPSRAWQWKIEGLSEAAFARGLLSSPEVAGRYRRGEIAYEDLREHHRVSSGLPGRLAQTSKALGLGDIAPGEDALVSLIGRLDGESSIALARAAVYATAISPAGLAAVCGLTDEQVHVAAGRWQDLSLAYSSRGLWTVQSSLRRSLLALLTQEEIRSAHKAAAIFLKDTAEAGRSVDLELSRLDLLLEARGHFMAAEEWNAAAELTGSISGYLRRRGYNGEIIRLNREIALSCASCSAEPSAWIGQAYLDQEDFKRAEEWYSRALEIAPGPAAYHGLGLSLMHQEKNERAKESLQKAADGFHASGNHSGEAAVLSALAALDMKKGESEAAAEKLDRIAEMMRARGDVPGEAQALQEAARLEMMCKNFEGARDRLRRSLELLQSSRDERGAAFALFNLASLDLERGDFQAAGEEYDRALPLFQEMGDRGGEAAILHSQGLIHARAGEKDKAAKCFKEALTINQELGDKAAEAGSFFQLGALAVQNDKMAEGLRLMALAAVVLRSIKSDEVKNVEPLVERLASQLNYSQEQFMAMVQEALQGYAKDRGWGLVEGAFGK